MDKVKIKINNREYEADRDATILEACRTAAIEIPTLCYLKEINAIGACRVCLVDVKGARAMPAACVQPIHEGMEIFTNTPAVRAARKANLELILSDHQKDCLSCIRNLDCELRILSADYGVEDEHHFTGRLSAGVPVENEDAAIVRDNNKCIACRRCVAACNDMQGISVIGPNNRGFDISIGCSFGVKLGDVPCIACGQCIVVCPVGALYEKDDTEAVWQAIADPTKHVAVCAAPSIRVTLGECFGNEPGTFVEGKLAASLRRLGFDGVYDMDFSADMTIMEEAAELVERIQNGGKLPLITSCSPGWVKYCEHFFPEFIENLSSCKSPQQMFGAIYKTHYAAKLGLDPKDIFFVSVIPCTAKKFEITREGQSAAGEGIRDVDAAITTRELARMIAKAGILFNELPDEEFDSLAATGSGAGVIFGTSGGVMEAALRTAAETILGEPLEKVDYEEVRGSKGIKTATYKIGAMDVCVAVASGTANAHKLLTAIKNGEMDVQFVEVMACPGGCVCGGGQPTHAAATRNFTDLWSKRAAGLYANDKDKPVRKSHENPLIKELYSEYLGSPGSQKAHEVLHTHYQARSKCVRKPEI
ncbi:MAG: [FeFe] hydrogenase, group A [Lachnospiraceae bacterium]|jgi:NADP-reducing hydrogenase subunit HndD|nr:[FeFe] hydrogenase, group A [Lachnospiraceae bacterium]